MVDEAQVRDAVERMSRHIVQALSRGDFDGYQAAFHLPGVGARPERGADVAVLASLLASWARPAGLMIDVAGLDQVTRIDDSPAVRRTVADLLDAGAAGDSARLEQLAVTALRLPDEDLWHVLHAVAAAYTTVVRMCGGLDRVEEVQGVLGAQTGPDEQEQALIAAIVAAAIGAGYGRAALRVLAGAAGRPDGDPILATVVTITLKAAARVLATGPAGPAVDVDDPRFPAGLDMSVLPELDDAGLPGRAVREVRQAIVGHLGAEGGPPPPAQLLRLPGTDHLIAAALYAAQTLAAQLPAAVQHYVDVEAAALDPDRH